LESRLQAAHQAASQLGIGSSLNSNEVVIMTGMDPIYLDHNATAPLLPQIAEAMAECDRAGLANPASQHAAGRRARRVLEESREGIAEILGVDLHSAQPDRLIFTSGGTEANNLALFGLAGDQPGRLIISAIEHPSVIGPAEQLARRGWIIERLRVDPDGVIKLDHLHDLFHAISTNPSTPHYSPLTTHSPVLLSLMLGNNETGVLQPIAEAAELASAAGILVHTDAVQVAGKLPIDFRALGVSAMSVTAHKFHGPRGIGALIARHGAPVQPLLFGGFQQGALRPGTESVTLAVGMQAALKLWLAERDERIAHMTQLRQRFEAALVAGWPSAVVHGRGAPRLPHTSAIGFLGLNRQALAMALDLAGVACSTGSACASGSTDPSPTLLAMGCPTAVVEGSLRFSLGASTTAAEIDEAVRRILQVCNDLQSRSESKKSPAKGRGNA
jgi:cysteine desulfurase